MIEAAPLARPLTAKLGIVLLNWNRPHLTLRCAVSVADAVGDYEHVVIVVDNGSTDDSVTRLRHELPDAVLIANDENMGFARGTNVGIREAISLGCSHIAIVNNDAVLGEGSLRRAVDVLVEDPTIGLVGGKLISPDSGRIWNAGASVNRFLARTTVIGAGEIDDGRWDLARDVEAITLALAVGGAKTFEKVGLLPEDYFFGQEEWDFSLSVARAGLRRRYEPSIMAWHGGDGSHRNSDPKFIYCGYRNKITFQSRNLPLWAFGIWVPAFTLYAVFLLPLVVPRLHADPPSGRVLRQCGLKAIGDHFRYGRRIELHHLEAAEASLSSGG